MIKHYPQALATSSGLSVREQLDQARKNALLRAAATESMARIRRQDTAMALSFALREAAKSCERK
jgi:AAA+ superfamily predicted ATPase